MYGLHNAQTLQPNDFNDAILPLGSALYASLATKAELVPWLYWLLARLIAKN